MFLFLKLLILTTNWFVEPVSLGKCLTSNTPVNFYSNIIMGRDGQGAYWSFHGFQCKNRLLERFCSNYFPKQRNSKNNVLRLFNESFKKWNFLFPIKVNFKFKTFAILWFIYKLLSLKIKSSVAPKKDTKTEV